jgi:ferredoxin
LAPPPGTSPRHSLLRRGIVERNTRRRKHHLILQQIILGVIAASASFGVERFPPPDFTTGHQLPTSYMPPVRPDLYNYIDIGALILALGLAAYLILARRSRRGIAGLAITSLIYFGFYREGCICPIGGIQNVALALGNHNYALPMVAGVFFLLPLLFALFFGRVFCSSVCPLGAAQDVVLRHPIKLPDWLIHPLSVLPWIYLGAAILYATTGTTFLICRYDPFVAFFRLGGSAFMLELGAVILILGIVIGRPYCRFACPYGAILRLLSPLAKWRVRITPVQCIQCRLCEESCPFGAINSPTTEKIARSEGRSRLTILLILLPLMVITGGLLGRLGSVQLSRLDPGVRLAERLWSEERGTAKGSSKESYAFSKLELPNTAAYKRALNIEHKYAVGSLMFGGWVGLVIGLKLISLSIRRRRSDYEPDSGGCFACGRCYSSCPVERARLGNPEAMRLLKERECSK